MSGCTSNAVAAAASALGDSCALEAMLSAQATCTLLCDDGRLPASAELLAVVSDPLRVALARMARSTSKEVKLPGVKTTTAKLVLGLVYPVPDRPPLTLDRLERVLPVLHKYNFEWQLKDATQKLVKELYIMGGSYDSSKPGYLIKYLLLAEQLQLKAIEDACLDLTRHLPSKCFLDKFKSGALDADLRRLSQDLMVHFMKAATQGGRGKPPAPPASPGGAALNTMLTLPITCTLLCDDGRLEASAEVLAVASKPFRDALANTPNHEIKLPGVDVSAAKLVLGLVYPVPDRPPLTLDKLERVLPVLHKYDFEWQYKDATLKLVKELYITGGSYDSAKPGYLIKFLLLAEELQLKVLEDTCLDLTKKVPSKCFLDKLKSGALDADLSRLSPDLMVRFMKAAAQPRPCRSPLRLGVAVASALALSYLSWQAGYTYLRRRVVPLSELLEGLDDTCQAAVLRVLSKRSAK